MILVNYLWYSLFGNKNNLYFVWPWLSRWKVLFWAGKGLPLSECAESMTRGDLSWAGRSRCHFILQTCLPLSPKLCHRSQKWFLFSSEKEILIIILSDFRKYQGNFNFLNQSKLSLNPWKLLLFCHKLWIFYSSSGK